MDETASTAEEQSRSLRRFVEYYPLFCGAFAVLVGVVALTGWWLGVASLTSVAPGLPPLVANTALMAALAGTSLILAAPGGSSRRRVLASKLCAGSAGLIAALTLAQYVFGVDLGIDQLLVATQVSLVAGHPGRPSPQTSATILMVATSLVLIDLRTARGRRPAEILALASAIVPLVVLLGYLFGAAALDDPLSLVPYTGMGVPMALVLLALSSGIIAARAETGALSVLLAADRAAELQEAKKSEERFRADLEELGHASSAISEAVADLPQSDLSAVLTTIALQAQSLTHADYVALGIGSDPEKPFHPWVFLGMGQDVVRAVGRFPRPVGTLGRVAREQDFIRTRDVRKNPHFRGLPSHHPEMESFLGVPISHRGRPVGTLYMAKKPGAPEFTERDERLMRMLAARVGADIETATLYTEESLQRTWLQNIIDQMPEGVLLYDGDGRLKAMNQVAAALSCEKTERADPFGNPAVVDARATDGSVLPEEKWPVVRVLRNQEALAREELLLRCRRGLLIPVAASAAPVRDASGRIAGVTLIFQDISAQKELERLREEWAAVVAHDLRQPVSTIRLAADSLLERQAAELPENQKVALERIRAASGRVSRMINDLLDASRIESKRLVVDCRVVNLAALIDAVVDGLEDVLGGHTLRVRVVPGLLAYVDADRIHQVLGNLISNAVKYGDAGSEIHIDVLPRGDVVEVIVTNHGPGIPPDQREQLFTRFLRARAARESREPGLGLGLYIAKGLIEAHGGRLWVESTPGETTSFHFTVPGRPPAPQVRDLPPTHAPS